MIGRRSIDPLATADAIVAQLRAMAANVHEMPRFVLRQWLVSVVGRVIVEMKTKAVEVQLVVPIGENFFGDLPVGQSMRLVGTSKSSSGYETHQSTATPLNIID